MYKKIAFFMGSTLLIFCAKLSAESLQQAIDYTINTNPNVLIASSNRLATDQALRQAKAGYLPTVDLFGAYGREHSKNATTKLARGGPALTLTRGEAGIIAIQNLFEGFKTMNEVAQNQAKVFSAAFEVNSTSQDIALEVARVYLDVIRTKQLIVLAKQNVAAHEKTYNMIKKRHEGGLAHRADLTQAGGRLALSRSNLIAEESNHQDAIVNYLQVVNKMPDNLEMPEVGQSFVPLSEEAVVEKTLESNPVLLAAIEEVSAAQAQHRATKSTNYPSLNIELSSSRNDNIDGVRGINNDDMAMLTASYNIYNGGADLAKQRETAYFLQSAIESKNLTQRQVIQNSKLSWISYVTARDQLPYLLTHKVASAETVILYAKQFQLGQRSLLDLLDSETEKFISAVSYVNGVFREITSKYEMLAVMGTLVEATYNKMPATASPEMKRKDMVLKYLSFNEPLEPLEKDKLDEEQAEYLGLSEDETLAVLKNRADERSLANNQKELAGAQTLNTAEVDSNVTLTKPSDNDTHGVNNIGKYSLVHLRQPFASNGNVKQPSLPLERQTIAADKTIVTQQKFVETSSVIKKRSVEKILANDHQENKRSGKFSQARLKAPFESNKKLKTLTYRKNRKNNDISLMALNNKALKLTTPENFTPISKSTWTNIIADNMPKQSVAKLEPLLLISPFSMQNSIVSKQDEQLLKATTQIAFNNNQGRNVRLQSPF